VLALIAILLSVFRPVHTVVVDGESMSPTFHNGQVLLVASPLFPLRRDTVVTAKVEGDTIIKRVAYLPGETVKLVDDAKDHTGTLLYDGTTDGFGEKMGWRRSDVTVPNQSVFLLGDNPPVSDDSRSFGPVEQAKITGVVVASL
jgi:signal peptidase I